MRLILQEARQPQLPVTRNQALNERNYGRLQGLNKTDVAATYGETQVAIWRRSFSVRPPGGESLADSADRVRPDYRSTIVPLLRAGDNILIVAHGNSLRALMMYLEHISDTAIAEVDLPTGIPRRYILDGSLRIENAASL